MEAVNAAEKLLAENLGKCRCCFRMLIDDRGAVVIDDKIRSQFSDLTQIELLESPSLFAEKICTLCANELKMFASLRLDLRQKQVAMYELANLSEEHYCVGGTTVCEEVEELNEDVTEYEVDDMDQEDTMMFEEQTINEDSEQDLEEDIASTIKIEKMKADENETFDDYFEEIIGEEVDDQNFMETEYILKEEHEMIPCETCGIEVPKVHLSEHISLMHKTFSCPKCDQSFDSKIQLRRHSFEVHGSEKVFRSRKRHFCPLCSKDYDYRKQLDDHIRSFHDKERNAQCRICHKTFYHRDLKKHIEHVHGEKNVACDTCGKRYTCVENLRLHMRYHQPPSYECSYEGCGKKFHQKVLWEHHEKKHTDVKPHNCDSCTNSFYSLRDLKRHFQRVHEKVTRKCEIRNCDMQFTRKDKYRIHLLKKHPELDEKERADFLAMIRSMKWNET